MVNEPASLRAVADGRSGSVGLSKGNGTPDSTVLLDSPGLADALWDNGELHRLLVDHMQDGLYMVGGDCFIFVNRALADMLGYTVAELTGKPYQEVIAPEYRAMARDRAARRRRGEAVPNSYETRYLHCDGITEIPVILNLRRALLKSGQPVNIGTVKDITDRVQAEKALRDSERQLYEAQRIGQLGHWRIDPDTADIQCSEMFCHILGLSSENGSLGIDQVIEVMHPDDRPAVQARRNQAIAENKPYEFVYRVLRPDGETRIIRGEGRPKYDANGKFLHVFGISQDITELKNIEGELLRERYRAESANRAKSNFLATMSHEIRTPLNAILGFSEMMDVGLFGPLGDSRYEGYIKGIRSSAEHLLEIIGDILDVSTIEAGEYSLNCAKLDPGDTVIESLQVVRAQALSAGISLQSVLPDELTPIFADRRAVKQILINLLGNAVKFTPSGGEITVGVKILPDAVQFHVSDTGIGIPAELLPDVTRPFERGRQSPLSAKEGTGLGLAIVDSLVALHGGKLTIESELDHGTDVRVVLPLNGPESLTVRMDPDQAPAENGVATRGAEVFGKLSQLAAE